MPPCQVGKETPSQSFGYIHYLYIYIYTYLIICIYFINFHYIYTYIIIIYIYIMYQVHQLWVFQAQVGGFYPSYQSYPRSFRRKMPRGAAPDPDILELELYLNYLAGKKMVWMGVGQFVYAPKIHIICATEIENQWFSGSCCNIWDLSKSKMSSFFLMDAGTT